MLLSERLRADLVALLVVVALGVTGILTPRDAFSGFASSAVVTIVSIFILTEALRVTGITDQAGRLLERVAGTSESRLVVVIMLTGATLSLLMNNIAAAAILLPAVFGLARRNRISPARLLMPLAFATILGGMATLFTTTNIIVSGILRGQNLPGFGVLDFAPVGIPIVVVGIVYMAVLGRRLLPRQADDGRMPERRITGTPTWSKSIGWASASSGHACRPARASSGKPLAESGLRETYGVNLVALERQGRLTPAPPAEMILAEGDIVFLEGKVEEFQATRRRALPGAAARARLAGKPSRIGGGGDGRSRVGAAFHPARPDTAHGPLPGEVRNERPRHLACGPADPHQPGRSAAGLWRCAAAPGTAQPDVLCCTPSRT